MKPPASASLPDYSELHYAKSCPHKRNLVMIPSIMAELKTLYLKPHAVFQTVMQKAQLSGNWASCFQFIFIFFLVYIYIHISPKSQASSISKPRRKLPPSLQSVDTNHELSRTHPPSVLGVSYIWAARRWFGKCSMHISVWTDQPNGTRTIRNGCGRPSKILVGLMRYKDGNRK